MQTIDQFPCIKKVALEIALDNGFINRMSPEERFWEHVDSVIVAEGVDFTDLKKIEEWIQTLSEEDILTLASGEHDEMVGIESTFSDPDLLNIFNDIFEFPL